MKTVVIARLERQILHVLTDLQQQCSQRGHLEWLSAGLPQDPYRVYIVWCQHVHTNA